MEHRLADGGLLRPRAAAMQAWRRGDAGMQVRCRVRAHCTMPALSKNRCECAQHIRVRLAVCWLGRAPRRVVLPCARPCVHRRIEGGGGGAGKDTPVDAGPQFGNDGDSLKHVGCKSRWAMCTKAQALHAPPAAACFTCMPHVQKDRNMGAVAAASSRPQQDSGAYIGM